MVDLVLVMLLCVGMLANSIQSLIAPFFPKLGEEKEVAEIYVSFIFSAQPAAAGLCAPLVGMLLVSTGRKKMLIGSTILLGVTVFLFSTMPLYSALPFVIIGISIRLLQGVAGSGVGTTQMAIISSIYRNNLDKIISLQQTLLGVSMIMGPLIGMVLNLIGGFEFIFYTFGSFFVIVTPLLCCFLPRDVPYEKTKLPVTWLTLFGVRTVPMNTLALIFCFMAYGSIEPVLSIYLSNQFGLSDTEIAAIFCVPTIAYPISAIIVNLLLKRLQKKVLLMISLVMVSIGMVMIGPASFTMIEPHLAISIVAVGIAGGGIAFCNIPMLPDMIEDCADQLPHLNKELISDRLSGLMVLSFFCGKAIGAPFSGLNDKIGFNDTAALVGGIVMLFCIFYGFVGNGFRACTTKKANIDRTLLLKESELVDTKKSYYFLEEEEDIK